MKNWTVYLSGEIHTDWREQLETGAKQLGLPVNFTSAVTHHESSDAAGDGLGKEEQPFWRDHKSAKVNAIRTKSLLEDCDIAVVRFGMPVTALRWARPTSLCTTKILSTPLKKWMARPWPGRKRRNK